MGGREALVENLKAALRTFTLTREDACVFEEQGLLCIYSGLKGGVFNAVMLTAPVSGETELRRKLEWVDSEYRALGASWTIWLGEHFLPPGLQARAPRILEDFHLAPQVRSPGMVAAEIVPPRRELPHLEILPVFAPALRYDFCYVMAQAFKTSMKTFLDMYHTVDYWEGPLQGFVGYQGGRAVGTVCTMDSGGVVGLYGVATHPDMQRRGVAERMVRHALDCAGRVSGCSKPVVLESSLEAVRLYENLGFAQVTTVTIYSEPK